MTQTPQSSSPAKPRSVNWRRMVKVWLILAASMVAVAAACWQAMPREAPTAAGASGTVARDLADIKNIVAPKGSTAARPWRYIIIHHSATMAATVQSITQGHLARGFTDIGYHFLINNGRSAGTRNGEVTATDRWVNQLAGAHTKVTDHPEFNNEGIGICLVGDFEAGPPTPEQMAALTMLVLALRQHYAIPIDRIGGHRDFEKTECPGRNFPMDRFLLDLHQAYLKSCRAPPRPDDERP